MLDEKEQVKEELWHMLYSKSKGARNRFDSYTEQMMTQKQAGKWMQCRKSCKLCPVSPSQFTSYGMEPNMSRQDEQA